RPNRSVAPTPSFDVSCTPGVPPMGCAVTGNSAGLRDEYCLHHPAPDSPPRLPDVEHLPEGSDLPRGIATHDEDVGLSTRSEAAGGRGAGRRAGAPGPMAPGARVVRARIAPGDEGPAWASMSISGTTPPGASQPRGESDPAVIRTPAWAMRPTASTRVSSARR